MHSLNLVSWYEFNPFLHTMSADKRFKISTNKLKVSDRVEIIVGRRENVGYQHNSYYHNFFKRLLSQACENLESCGKGSTSIHDVYQYSKMKVKVLLQPFVCMQRGLTFCQTACNCYNHKDECCDIRRKC